MIKKITIYGNPIGKPRMTQRDKWKKRPCVMKYRAWADKARVCAGELPPADKILSLSWIAYFEPPVSWSKNKRESMIGELHRSKPDRDNIDKALLDALFDDDKAIAAGTITKLWGTKARLEVEIEYEK